MQIWAESGKSALPICNYSQILYQFLTFTQNLKRSQSAEDSHDTAVLCVVYSVIPSSTTRLSSIDSASFDDIHYPVSHQIQLVNIVY